MKERIQDELRRIEREDEVRVLLAVNTFLGERIAHFREITGDHPRRFTPGLGPLDALFRHALEETWGPSILSPEET